MLEKLKKTIDGIKTHQLYEPYNGTFPDHDQIRYPKTHLSIIVNQAEKIINSQPETTNHIGLVAGITILEKDTVKLAEEFLDEIILFCTENKIDSIIKLIDNSMIAKYSHSIITSKALYNIARSKELNHTYEKIELLGLLNDYDRYSVPFIIRLSIENKLKSMIALKILM